MYSAFPSGERQSLSLRLNIEYRSLCKLKGCKLFFISPIQDVYALKVLAGDEKTRLIMKMKSVNRVWKFCNQLAIFRFELIPKYDQAIASCRKKFRFFGRWL